MKKMLSLLISKEKEVETKIFVPNRRILLQPMCNKEVSVLLD